MKPAWEELGTKYQASSSVVIGDVDCTQHADLCQTHEVQGYPTIKYFKGGKAQAYNGGRDINQLDQFVQDTLLVKCNINDSANCSEKELAFLEKMKKDPENVPKQLERLKAMTAKSMAPELLDWVYARLNILTQLSQ
mmetsp:Transcript_1082/g.1258  ORF Transcript_1082/g.1258 Transcript_1082/m.1258 type:complete len:137 (-) Transcript_1082:272-682(-)|eukprot:CAMPEP_0197854208 /NCGR_PEP_ID=MMETSP1438-20131217/24251_1 /TAXON_ID=1461541 /ORGANISM="Pterosperma sp., Strain CCMP1384" /LENGTH=136 /DNA_ID=CAMNT_0043468869 /DNA_START=247 /DNA_END=657 /DNA_ORIENTATION=+